MWEDEDIVFSNVIVDFVSVGAVDDDICRKISRVSEMNLSDQIGTHRYLATVCSS